jgi:hypothetical protein
MLAMVWTSSVHPISSLKSPPWTFGLPPLLHLIQLNQAAARLPEFVEPMKATLVDSMPAGSWIY